MGFAMIDPYFRIADGIVGCAGHAKHEPGVRWRSEARLAGQRGVPFRRGAPGSRVAVAKTFGSSFQINLNKKTEQNVYPAL